MSPDFVDRFEKALALLRKRHGNREYNRLQARLALLLVNRLDRDDQAQVAPYVASAKTVIDQPSSEDAHLKLVWDKISTCEQESGMSAVSFALRSLAAAYRCNSDRFQDGDEYQFAGWFVWSAEEVMNFSESQITVLLREAGLELAG